MHAARRALSRAVSWRLSTKPPAPQRWLSAAASRGATSPWAAADEQLQALEEVQAAHDMCARGLARRAVPLLQRALEICSSAVGKDSDMARAALKRLAEAQYAAGHLEAAQQLLERLTAMAAPGGPQEELAAPLLLLSTIMLFRGDPAADAAASGCAVELFESDSSATPDMAALGRALRLHGVAGLLTGDDEDAAEDSLRRAARLGDSRAEQAQAVSVMAAFEFARAVAGGSGDGDAASTSRKEAFGYWDAALEACADPTGPAGGSGAAGGSSDSAETNAEAPAAPACGGGGGAGSSSGSSGAEKEAEVSASDRRIVRACVLCNAAEAELYGEAAVASVRAAERLAEALKIREAEMPQIDHPAVGWTLALLARSQHLAGSAVTAEGLFRAAVEKVAAGCVDEGHRAVAGLPPSPAAAAEPTFPSPAAPYALAQALEWHGALLLQWEKREAEGRQLQQRSEKLRAALPLQPPPGLSVHMLHLDDGWGSRPWL